VYTAVAAGLNFVEKKIGTWNDPENSRVINYLVSAVLLPEPWLLVVVVGGCSWKVPIIYRSVLKVYLLVLVVVGCCWLLLVVAGCWLRPSEYGTYRSTGHRTRIRFLGTAVLHVARSTQAPRYLGAWARSIFSVY
jgi:hypothetical protein